MEFLDIADGQPLDTRNQNPAMVQRMIKVSH